MGSKPRPPLTPADSQYLGLDTFGWHTLAWPSQSRSGVTHHTQGKAGHGYSCTCKGWEHRQTCKHVLSFDAALAYHLDPPPADPGGAALTAAQDALNAEQGDWEMVEMSPEHPGGFWTATAYGPMHISGDPHMSDETLGALREMAELAVRQHLDPAPNDLDSALALAGGWWAVSRAPGDWPVILTCNNCGATRGWQTEAEAARFIREDGTCRCDHPTEAFAGPTPPARGAARRPLDDCLQDLYGE